MTETRRNLVVLRVKEFPERSTPTIGYLLIPEEVLQYVYVVALIAELVCFGRAILA